MGPHARNRLTNPVFILPAHAAEILCAVRLSMSSSTCDGDPGSATSHLVDRWRLIGMLADVGVSALRCQFWYQLVLLEGRGTIRRIRQVRRETNRFTKRCRLLASAV
jgi:hypothetical protein